MARKPASDGVGSLTNVAWAAQQVCAEPLDKLLLLRIADGVGSGLRYVFSIDALAAYCCASRSACVAALLRMDESGLLSVFAMVEEVEVALPWYRPPAPPKDKPKREFQNRPDLRHEMWVRQDGCCWYCGDDLAEGDTPHIDHQMPISRGGADDIANFVLSCGRCNIRKGAKTLEEFRRYVSEDMDDPVTFHGERE